MKKMLRFWWLLVVILIPLALTLLPPLPPFRLKEVVVVSPPTRLSELDLVSLTGVSRGENLLTLRLKKVRQNLLKFPWIEEVALAKSYPGRLVVSVSEQQPVALVKKDQLYLVNRRGEVFKKMEAGDPKDLPVLSGQDSFSRKELLPLVELIGSFQGRPALKAAGLSEIFRSSKEGLVIFTIRPRARIVLGKEEWEKRLDRLAQILPSLTGGKKGRLAIDLTYEKRIFVKR